ncbi:MAG: hypothetical protein E6510_06575 [Gemella haemolysans]|uniref:hypothetical protein n=1 Tax=Gemella haemolysans TaxID=1379 RepID=UPI00290A480D|nr:hypothetical protein [Gemella haemolysans]MDU6573866.1 hypothetical protein [Gemella haemolysans]
MKKNNKTIISIISVIIAAVICFIGYNSYQRKQAEVVSSEKLTALHELTKKFNDKNDRNERLNILKETLDEQSQYNLNSNKEPKVQDEFKNSINTMRTYFHNDYDNTIKTYTLSDITTVSDEKKINDNKSKLNELTKTIETEKDYTFESEQQAQEKQTEVEKLVKKYDERINELKKKENDKKQQKSSSKSEAKTEQTASTHYENDYFSVDVPDKWAGIWSFTEVTDTSNLGTPSQPAKIYSFKHDPEGNVPFGGAQAIYVFPNGIPSKSESSPMLKKLRSNVYLAPGAASGFFSIDGKPDRATINVK